MTYIYNAPESPGDNRYNYQWELLKTALETTKDKYGDYHMEASIVMSEVRQAHELKNATELLTVMYLGQLF